MSRNTVRLGINGFGRIGRIAARIALKRSGIEIAAVNSRASAASHAYLLKYDSSYGTFPLDIKATDDSLLVDGMKIAVYQESDPDLVPWEKEKVDVVLEATGAFRKLADASRHLSAGAKFVIVTAPPKDDIPTFCLGVNDQKLDPFKDRVVSNASCTTNCLATVAKVLEDNFGIDRGFMTTMHAYTDSQNLLDNSHQKDLRLSRSAANNIIPADTGASKALGLVIPNLKGKIVSSAIRVPTAIVSIIDLTVLVKKPVGIESVNTAFKKTAMGTMKGILQYLEEPLVSSDLKGSPYSAIVDGLLTQVNGNIVNVKAWYDNEWGYSARLIDLVTLLGKSL